MVRLLARGDIAPEHKVSGGHGGGETPVPIPNTAVKPTRADGTWGEAPWESRSLPEFIDEKPLRLDDVSDGGAFSRPRPPSCQYSGIYAFFLPPSFAPS